MKCPMSFQIGYDPDNNLECHSDECLGVECQWWVAGDQDCTMQALAKTLLLLTGTLREIRQIMPERTQFLK
jgi:hypothetical protein